MSDRELLTECLDVLTHDAAQRTFAGGVRMSQLAIKLRTHLAAPRPEPVAWGVRPKSGGELNYATVKPQIGWDDLGFLEMVPLYTAAAAPEPVRHPGYIIGNHWLETAYERLCAGEAEADVLKDCGWERVTDAEALRREAERLNWVRVELFRPIWDGATDKPCEWHLRDDYKHTIQRMQGNNFRAAIDAAMEPATEPAIRAREQEVPR